MTMHHCVKSIRWLCYTCCVVFVTLLFFCLSPSTASAYSGLTCTQTVQGEHPSYAGIRETFSNVQLCVYDTGYTGSLRDIHVDKKQGIILPKDASKVREVYIYFSGKGGGSPADNCVGPSKLCQQAERRGDIAIVLFNREADQNNMLPTEQSMRFFFDETKQVMNELGIQASTYHLAGHSAGGKQVWQAAQFLSNVQFGYSLIFDGCYGTWCDDLVKQTNRGYTIMYLNTGELTTAQSVVDAKPSNITVYEIPANIVHGQIPFLCFRDHFAHDGCGGEIKTVYTNGQAQTASNQQNQRTLQTVKDEVADLLKEPSPKISLPGLSFTPLSVVKESVNMDGGNNFYVRIPYLSEYMAALFRYGIAAVILIAIVVIIISGMLWSLSGGNTEAISKAKKLLGQSIIGLILELGSYTILSFINPNLTELDALNVLYVSETSFPGSADEESFYSQVNTTAALTGQEFLLPNKNYCFPLQQDSLSQISWNWGDRRDGGNSCHVGIDIYTKAPGKVLAVDDGVVMNIGNFLTCKDGWGVKSEGISSGATSQLVVYHETLGITINYGEIDSNKVTVSEGDHVTKGQELGVASYCGMLHFETYSGKQTHNLAWWPNSVINEKNGCATNHLNKKPAPVLNPSGVITQLNSSFCQ